MDKIKKRVNLVILISQILSVVIMLNLAFLPPVWGAWIFVGATFLQKVALMVADYLDDGEMNNSVKPVNVTNNSKE